MDLTKLTVILLLLAASMCRGKLVIKKTSKYQKTIDRFSDVLVNAITSCYKGRINGVGIAGKMPRTLYRTLSVEHSMPVAMMDNYKKYSNRYRTKETKFKQGLNVFIVQAADYKTMFGIIQRGIRPSIWWNYLASFFIIDLSPGCIKRDDLALCAWFLDLIHVVVLCRRHKSGRIMFAYNPYTSKAPAFWQKENFTELTESDHPFTMFSREYRGNDAIMCADLMFDKTADLGRSTVRIRGPPDDFSQKTTDSHGRGVYAFETRRRSILATLFRNLNATVRFIDGETEQYHKMDVDPIGWQYRLDYGFLITYPHRQVEASVITQFRGHKSQLTKILSIIDANSQFGLGVVYFITLIFLKIFVRQAVVPAVLNLIRMTCNTGFVRLPNNTASRIYLGCLLFFVVTMQGIFQGDLAARLTKYIPVQNVESFQDLEELGYSKVYGKEYYKRVFEGSEMQKKFIVNDDEGNCIMHVTDDLSSAYIGRTESFIIDLVEKLNLHVSRKPVEMIYVGFPIYPDWALTERMNKMISRIVEANALELWAVKCKPIELSDFYVDPMVKSNVDFKNLELRELLFAFEILGIGLSCASVVLIIELAIAYKCICAITFWQHGDRWEQRFVEIHN